MFIRGERFRYNIVYSPIKFIIVVTNNRTQ